MTQTTVSNVNFRLRDNEYFTGTMRNSTGGELTFTEGSLVTFNAADGKYYPYAENSVLKPIGILGSDTTISATSDGNVSVCVWGEVDSGGMTFPGSATADTVPTSNGGTAMAITADGGNTGDGVAGAITQGSLAKAGTYTLTCIDAAVSGSEIFQVVDPEGSVMAPLTVAVAYDNGAFAVTIADGATDFIVGDSFTVVGDVAAESSIRLMLKDTGILVFDVTQMVE